jgi:hypothetical protein
MKRVTRADIDHDFNVMVNAALNAGVDVNGWEFGRPYGLMWVVTADTGSGRRPISPYWETFRQARDGMDAMRKAFDIVYFGKAVK